MTYTKDNIIFEPLPTSPRFIDLTLRNFHHLNVLGFAGNEPVGQQGRSHPMWWCQCDCGNLTKVNRDDLRTGNTQSCGCLRQTLGVFYKTHGETSNGVSPEYKAFHHAKSRCQNPNDPKYRIYGKRGIEFRLTSVMDILDTIGRRPTPQHTLDRIEVNGHYESGNIRWASPKMQARNTRTNRLLTLNGETKCLAQWGEDGQLDAHVIGKRLKRGWCEECAIKNPPKHSCPHR